VRARSSHKAEAGSSLDYERLRTSRATPSQVAASDDMRMFKAPSYLRALK